MDTSQIIYYGAILACFIVLAILMVGLGNFAFRSKRTGHAATSNKIMRWRVIMQAVAIVILMLVAYFAKQGN